MSPIQDERLRQILADPDRLARMTADGIANMIMELCREQTDRFCSREENQPPVFDSYEGPTDAQAEQMEMTQAGFARICHEHDEAIAVAIQMHRRLLSERPEREAINARNLQCRQEKPELTVPDKPTGLKEAPQMTVAWLFYSTREPGNSDIQPGSRASASLPGKSAGRAHVAPEYRTHPSDYLSVDLNPIQALTGVPLDGLAVARVEIGGALEDCRGERVSQIDLIDRQESTDVTKTRIYCQELSFIWTRGARLAAWEFSLQCAEEALGLASAPDIRSLNALGTLRRWLTGHATEEELEIAKVQAVSAASELRGQENSSATTSKQASARYSAAKCARSLFAATAPDSTAAHLRDAIQTARNVPGELASTPECSADFGDSEGFDPEEFSFDASDLGRDEAYRKICSEQRREFDRVLSALAPSCTSGKGVGSPWRSLFGKMRGSIFGSGPD